jgi:3D (Asp-Asp-Asp) domain-containing protein
MCTSSIWGGKWLKLAKTSLKASLVMGLILASSQPFSLADEPLTVPSNLKPSDSSQLITTDQTFLLPLKLQTVKERRWVTVTGYSSTVEETDEDPFITASGKWVADGFVASNALPFGTQIRFPELFPNKIFIVEDRMNQRYDEEHIDIWFNSKELAKEFGVKYTLMEIL